VARIRRLFLFAFVLIAGLVGSASPAAAQSAVLTSTLTGANAVPGPGDPDGSGFAYVIVIDETNTVCAFIFVQDIAPATAAHIHFGAAGETGGHAVDMVAPTNGFSWHCDTASEEVVDEMVAHPENFYMNVHNAEYINGALRGQLRPA
jgi:hypothetical protein